MKPITACKARILFVVMMAALLLGGVASAQTTLSTGGADSWNTGTWSAGVPSGAASAIIAAAVQADVNNAATPTYTGSLTLNSGSKLTVQNNAESMNALSGDPIILNGASLQIARNVGFTISSALTLSGSGSINCSGIGANTATFGGVIGGSGELSFTMNGNNHVSFTASNNITGGMVFNATGKSVALFDAPGSAGQGNVTQVPTGTGAYTWLYLRANDVFDDNATLTLEGTPGANGGMGGSPSVTTSALLVMQSYNDTVSNLFVNGYQYPAGI